MKSLLLFAMLAAVAQAASIHHQKRSADIPVEIVYDDKPSNVVRHLENLEEKPQINLVQEEVTPSSPEEVKEPEVIVIPASGEKNLEAKPQLSVAEEAVALKNLPVAVDDANKVKIVTPDEAVEVVQPALSLENSAPYQEQNIDDIYDKILEIINNGAKKIKTDFEQIPESEQSAPQKQDILTKVNATLEEFLDSTKKLIALRGVGTLKQDAGAPTQSPIPNPGNIFQQIINSFQTFSSNLFSGLNPAGQPGVQSEGATAAPSGPPNPLQIAQGIFNQLQGNLGSLFGARPPNAQSDDSGTTQGPQNPFQFFQQQFNNIFNRPTPTPGTQGDEVVTPAPSNPIVGFVQGAISNVQNAFNPSAATPAQHDEVTQGTTTPGGPLGFFQQAGQQVINAFRPPGGAALGTATTPANPAASAITNAQNQLTQAFPQLGGGQVPAIPSVPSIPSIPGAPAIPENPFQQQAQQAINAGAGGANQVVSNLAQQGVPVPEQVGGAISAAQQAAQQGANVGAGSTSKPDASPAAPVTPALPAVPATPEVSEAPAADEVPADEVEQEEVKEAVPVVQEILATPETIDEKKKEPQPVQQHQEEENVKVPVVPNNIDDADVPKNEVVPEIIPEVQAIAV